MRRSVPVLQLQARRKSMPVKTLTDAKYILPNIANDQPEQTRNVLQFSCFSGCLLLVLLSSLVLCVFVFCQCTFSAHGVACFLLSN